MSAADLGRGDVAWTSNDPDAGQAKHHAWLVLSDPALHRSRGLFLGVPLIHTDRGWGTHVVLDPDVEPVSVAVCEQLRAMSTQRITKIEPAPYPSAMIDEVHQVVVLLTSAR